MPLPVFVCCVCGKQHHALPPEDPPETDPAKRAELKAAWRKAYDRFDPPPRAAPIAESRYMLGRLFKMWLGFARTHAEEGRPEHAWECLSTAVKHLERRKFLASKAERDRRHTLAEKAATAYFSAVRYTGVPRVPATISTSNDGTLYLRCTRTCKPARHDGLRRQCSFFVVQLFDHEGYHSSVTTTTMKELYGLVTKRSANKEIVASSLPFKGTWSGLIMDVSAPPDFKEVLALLEKPGRDDEPEPTPPKDTTHKPLKAPQLPPQPPLAQTQLVGGGSDDHRPGADTG